MRCDMQNLRGMIRCRARMLFLMVSVDIGCLGRVPIMKMAVDSCLDDVHYFVFCVTLVTLLLSIIYEGGEY